MCSVTSQGRSTYDGVCEKLFLSRTKGADIKQETAGTFFSPLLSAETRG